MGTIVFNFIKMNGDKIFSKTVSGLGSVVTIIAKGLNSFIVVFLKPFLFSRKRKVMIVPYFWATIGNIALFSLIFIDIFIIIDYIFFGLIIKDPITTFASIQTLIATLIVFNQSMIAIYNKGKDDGSDFTEDKPTEDKPTGVM